MSSDALPKELEATLPARLQKTHRKHRSRTGNTMPQRSTKKVPNVSSETFPKELETTLPARLQKTHRKQDTAAQNKAPAGREHHASESSNVSSESIKNNSYSAAAAVAAYRQTAALRPPYRTPGHTETARNFVPKSRPHRAKKCFTRRLNLLKPLTRKKRLNVSSESVETRKGCCCCCCCCCCTNTNL